MKLVGSCGLFIFTNKKPPVKTLTNFLSTHGITSSLSCIWTDQGSELAKSRDFRECIANAGYTLESMGTGASFQNIMAERPHVTLANMMRQMLTGSNLESEYWSHAIRHAVYIKNRLPHHSLPNHVPLFKRYTNSRPDLSHVRVFGSHITVKKPRVRKYKLDTTHITTGTFLDFTESDRTIWIEDKTTGEIRSARHAVFDKDHFSTNQRLPYAQ